MDEATIEDLAMMIRFSRESDEGRRRGCIEHDYDNRLEMQAIIGTVARVDEIGVNARSSETPRRTEREWRLKSSREQNHP